MKSDSKSVESTPDQGDRPRLVAAAHLFAPMLANPDLTAEEIDTVIEELRPLRMHIHAIDYGDAPGFRPSSKKE